MWSICPGDGMRTPLISGTTAPKFEIFQWGVRLTRTSVCTKIGTFSFKYADLARGVPSKQVKSYFDSRAKTADDFCQTTILKIVRWPEVSRYTVFNKPGYHQLIQFGSFPGDWRQSGVVGWGRCAQTAKSMEAPPCYTCISD